MDRDTRRRLREADWEDIGIRLTAYATNIRMQSAAAVAVGAAILLLLARFVVRHSRRAKTTRDPVTTSQSVTVR